MTTQGSAKGRIVLYLMRRLGPAFDKLDNSELNTLLDALQSEAVAHMAKVPAELPQLERRPDDDRRKRLDDVCRDIGRMIGDAIPRGAGFALMVFDFGDRGFLSWLSNASRDDMVRVLSEFRQRLLNDSAGGHVG